MMETTIRGKKRVNKRSNVDKFNENIGPAKSMKDKMKSEKSTLLQSVDGMKTEPNLEVDFKKEPVLNNPICENESKNSNICSKTGDVKCIKPGLMESVNVNKIQDRPFLDSKGEIGSRPDDGSEEDDLQANLMSSKLKAKAMPSDSNMFGADSNESLILGLCNQNLTGPQNSNPGMEQPGSCLQPGVQPLPSNVINKQPGTMEAQYMQQQSQIFVFTTALANKSAESVLQGQYPSIIAYHCAQPGTKKYLEKHPLKLNQFHRQSSAQWLNNLAHIKQKTVFGGNAHLKPMGQMPLAPRLPGNMAGPCDMPQGPGSGPGPGPGPGPRAMGPNMQGPVPELEGMNEQNEIPPSNREIGDHRHSEFPGGINPMNHINLWNQGSINQNSMSYSGSMKNLDREKPCVMTRPPLENINPSHFSGVSQLTLTGTKVPTENLTPQQRQHRAEQLATLRKMQEILFPENQAPPTDEFGNPRIVMPGNKNPSTEDSNRNIALDNSEMKNQLVLKNVNSSNLNNNNPNNGNSNSNNNNNNNNNNSNNNSNNNNNNNNSNNSNNSGNNCSGSSNIISNNGNNGNTSGSNNNSNNNSNSNSNNSNNNNNNCNSNSPMNRLIARNISGQSNRNLPLDNSMNHSAVNAPNAVLDISESIDSLQEQNSHAVQKISGGNTFPSVAAQLEWQKHYQQFQEEQKKNKGARTDSPVSRGCNKMQGPPPPYHQTTRSASVPIAVPSPNPGSPSNTTSNLSLPSPRTSSDLNSPSDLNKHASASGGGVKISACSPPNNQGSPSCSKVLSNNPDTPISTSASQSPTPTPRKESSQPPGLDFSSKDLFSRSASSLTQQKHQKQQNVPTNKEPNLMPVPSPQQIHYLNTFEGQELTIQKQPNTSLKETTINSPLNHTPLSETPKCKTPNGAANSPLSQVPDTSPRFSNIGPATSTTCTTPVSTQSQTNIPTSKDTTTVPSSPDTAGPSPCRSENLPLNPNGINCPPSNKSMHFDPITSLAQMSQQLTNQNAPPCPGAGPMMYNSSSMHMVGNLNHMEQHVVPVGPGGTIVSMGHENPPMENIQFPPSNPIISCSGPMMDMPPGFMNTSSPKQNMGNPPPRCVAPFGFGGSSGPGFQKMMSPNTYNGMNVQVKASTPNTIQYLPARPNTNSPNTNSRGPPSLDFLQRFTNPMNSLDSKVSFIPNCHSNSMEGVNSGGNPGGPLNCGGPVNNSSGNLMPNSVPNMLLGGNMVLNPGPVGSLRGQLRTGPAGMMKVPQLGGGGPGGPVFPPSPACDPMIMGPGGNAGMFIQGSKSSPLGMPPDASQPLPPSMSQGNNFKNSPFVGPTIADPNYAQQFHNFQQQLYATNTRNHQMSSHMNQSYFLPK